MDNDRVVHYIECSCTDSEHTIRLTKYKDDVDWDHWVYVSYYLSNNDNIFKRIWTAIKYIFGYKSRYGDFGETLLEEKEIKKIIKYLQDALEDWKKNNG